MRKLLYNYSQILGLIKLLCYKLIFGKSLVLKGLPHNSHKATIRIRKGGKVILNDRSSFPEGNYLWVTEGAEFQFGEKSRFGQNCIISCKEKIVIGKNVMIGPCSTLYDNDHVYGVDIIANQSGYKTSPIIIGDNVWTGNNVKILKGVTIGEGCVIAAGSIVNRDVPPNSIFYNRKEDVCKPKK